MVKVFEIRDTDTSNLSLKLSKNIKVLSLTKTIKNSSNNELSFTNTETDLGLLQHPRWSSL